MIPGYTMAEWGIKNLVKRLSSDTFGRLRVAAESAVISSGTLTTLTTCTTCATVTNITNWGLTNATAKSQLESRLGYDNGFRRNLSKV